jgi:hypothetical protein
MCSPIAWERCAVFRPCPIPREHRSGGTLIGRTEHQKAKRVDHRAARENFRSRDRLAVHGAIVVHRVRVVLLGHQRQLLLGGAVIIHVTVNGERELRRVDSMSDLLSPTIEVIHIHEAPWHLLEPDRQNGVELSRDQGLTGTQQCCSSGGARVLDVDDRYPGGAHARRQPVPCAGACVHVSTEERVDIRPRHLGVAECLERRVDPEIDRAAAREAPKGMHPDAGHDHVAHQGNTWR